MHIGVEGKLFCYIIGGGGWFGRHDVIIAGCEH